MWNSNFIANKSSVRSQGHRSASSPPLWHYKAEWHSGSRAPGAHRAWNVSCWACPARSLSPRIGEQLCLSFLKSTSRLTQLDVFAFCQKVWRFYLVVSFGMSYILFYSFFKAHHQKGENSTKGSLGKTMVFPVVMSGCKSWTIKKAECLKIDVSELWC